MLSRYPVNRARYRTHSPITEHVDVAVCWKLIAGAMYRLLRTRVGGYILARLEKDKFEKCSIALFFGSVNLINYTVLMQLWKVLEREIV